MSSEPSEHQEFNALNGLLEDMGQGASPRQRLAPIYQPHTTRASRQEHLVFRHVVAGIHIGRMQPTPHVGEFDAVLTVGEDVGLVENGIRLKHVHLPYGHPELSHDALSECAHWVNAQARENRRVLVRSEGGRQRPALVTALVVLRMGGTETDALECIWKADIRAMTDFRYRRILKNEARALRPSVF